MAAPIDWSGVGVVITASAGAVVLVGGFVLNAIRTLRSDMVTQQNDMKTKLAVIDIKLDGQGVKLNDALEAAALAKGKAEGIKEERAAPQVAAGVQGDSAGPTILQTDALQVQAKEVGVQKMAKTKDAHSKPGTKK